LSILVRMYSFFFRKPLWLRLNCTRNKSVSVFFGNRFRSYEHLMDHALRLCRKACKSSRFHFSVRLIRRRTRSKTVIIFLYIEFHEKSFILSPVGMCGRTEWKKFYSSVFFFFSWSSPRKKKLSRAQGHAEVGR
jgi:hypothetical protein